MKNNVKKMCEAAVLLALGILLPMFFHLFGAGGPVFLPMHLPVLLAGFLLGPLYGALIGLLSPLLSFLFTQMPQIGGLPGMTCHCEGIEFFIQSETQMDIGETRFRVE